MRKSTIESVRVAVLAGSLLFLHCLNGFFPPIGESASGVLRTTPAGLVQQLIISYQTKHLSVFRDIIDETSFRFYISPTILSQLRSVDKGRTEYIPPDSVAFIAGNTYTYLTAQDEIALHRTMFAHADTLQFMEKPVIDSIYYERVFNHFDTIVLHDTLNDTATRADTIIREVYDTLTATLLLWPSKIKIAAGEIAQEYQTGTNVFEIGQQVFYARRQEDRLWKLVKWFELDY